jgi:phospholipid-binding lipoprotein MlaA
MMRLGLKIAACLALLSSVGCASFPAGRVQDSRDPLESYNRAVFEFNEQLDRSVVKPAAEAYRDYVPDLFQFLARNFFGNIRDVPTAVHHGLQGKPKQAVDTAARVVINTTIGFFGLGDPASELGYAKTSEDFGETLGRWGVGPGPYFVLPLLGPSTIRDTVGTALDMTVDPTMETVLPRSSDRVAAFGVRALDRRVEFMAMEGALSAISFDRYSAVREAYLARRLSQVYDGDPPQRPMKVD